MAYPQGPRQPGWYPNVNGDLYYWDGIRWIDRPARKAEQQQPIQVPIAPPASVPLPTIRPPSASLPVQRLNTQSPNIKPLLSAILIVLGVIAIALMSSKPWESDAYKQCVAEQRAAAGGKSNMNSKLESAIETYCHNNYD